MTQTRSDAAKFSELIQWFETGKINVKQPQVYVFYQAKEALALVENRKAKSKVVLEL